MLDEALYPAPLPGASSMAIHAATVIAVAVVVVMAGFGYVLYTTYFSPTGSAVGSKNWAGYEDQQSVGSTNGTITLPPASDWKGNGVASLWIGMGGSVANGVSQWPFWQAGVQVSCASGYCSAELFDEGGTQGPPCNGVCPVDWTQTFGVEVGDAITVSLYGSASGAVAVLTVDQNGFNSTYHPPVWTVLAGVTTFPSAEWIFESPEGSSGMLVMPTLTPPGAVFSGLGDSAQLSQTGAVQMQDNPHGQSVGLSSFQGASFSAYSFDS